MANNTTNGYRLEEYGDFNNTTGEAIITFVFTEYMQSGEYSVNYLSLIDYAENESGYSFYFDGTGSGGYPATFTFYSENPDYLSHPSSKSTAADDSSFITSPFGASSS